LNCDFDGLELGLQVSQVSTLHVELVPLAQDLDLLLLDETALFFDLRADILPTSHSVPSCFIRSGPRPWQGPLRTMPQRVREERRQNCTVLNSAGQSRAREPRGVRFFLTPTPRSTRHRYCGSARMAAII
jgi:hypothetical protein